MGHKEADCSTKQKDEQQHANFTEQQQEEGNLFMSHSSIDVGSDDVWIIDSGCSNHMSGRSLFKELDESGKSEFHLGNEKAMTVDGKGTIALKTSHGNVKLLHDVQYVPCLAHNLLSVGQLMNCG